MYPQFQFEWRASIASSMERGLFAALLLAVLSVNAAIARGQDAPAGAVGRVQGKDVSVEGGTAAGNGGATAAPSMYVVSGSVVTVHAGKARLTLFSGGDVEICGPAKFTVLQSANSITLALNFGRVQVELPARTALRIFTPTIIGTPLDISGGTRDITVGLNLDDSLCVLATSGAIQLEHQFSGEKLIVPQAGEFFLNAGRLLPVAGTPGSCQCEADEPQPTPASPATIPEFAVAVPPANKPAAATPLSKPAPSAPASAPETNVEYSVLANANEEHPVIPPAKDKPAAPPVSIPAYTAVLPPLIYSADTPLPPPGPSQEMVLLIREARVAPDYEFSGHVDAPEFAKEMQRALGEHSSDQAPQVGAANAPADPPQKKKGGFWSAVKRAFGG
jgi:hypothetical protein